MHKFLAPIFNLVSNIRNGINWPIAIGLSWIALTIFDNIKESNRIQSDEIEYNKRPYNPDEFDVDGGSIDQQAFFNQYDVMNKKSYRAEILDNKKYHEIIEKNKSLIHEHKDLYQCFVDLANTANKIDTARVDLYQCIYYSQQDYSGMTPCKRKAAYLDSIFNVYKNTVDKTNNLLELYRK